MSSSLLRRVIKLEQAVHDERTRHMRSFLVRVEERMLLTHESFNDAAEAVIENLNKIQVTALIAELDGSDVTSGDPVEDSQNIELTAAPGSTAG
jgi:hypothetical protein